VHCLPCVEVERRFLQEGQNLHIPKHQTLGTETLHTHTNGESLKSVLLASDPKMGRGTGFKLTMQTQVSG